MIACLRDHEIRTLIPRSTPRPETGAAFSLIAELACSRSTHENRDATGVQSRDRVLRVAPSSLYWSRIGRNWLVMRG